MGTATYAFGVDLEQVNAAIGSSDSGLVATICGNLRPDPFAQPGDPTVADAVQKLVDGERDESYEGRALQLYALEALCEHLGERLAGEGHVGYIDDLGWDTKLLATRIPFGLPEAPDFPGVSHLTAEEAREEYGRFSEMDVDCEEGWIEEAREAFIGWLQQCAKRGCALVTFQY